ncbi:MAG: cupin-like domain-containing protein [Planctomycetota bacterium]
MKQGVTEQWLGSSFDAAQWSPAALLHGDVANVEVEAQVSANGVFPGDEERRRSVRTRLENLLSNPRMYACQAPIATRVEGRWRTNPALERLLLVPGFCSGPAKVNAWIGCGATRTTLHFDDDDNVLTVLSGEKLVRLRAHAQVEPLPCWTASPNHSHQELSGGEEIRVRAGEALFIPRGWWHQIDSAPETVAVNVWFKLPYRDDVDYEARAWIVNATRNEVKRRISRRATKFKNLAPPTIAAALWMVADKVDVLGLVQDEERDVLAARLRARRDLFYRRCYLYIARRILVRRTLRRRRRWLNQRIPR